MINVIFVKIFSMRATAISVFIFVSLCFCAALTCRAQDSVPDTVRAGIYVTSIHDIDFRQKEYTISFWLWLNYTNPEFNFLENLEIPMAKTVSRSFATTDSADGRISLLMKLQCVMKDSWKTENFPFDRQKLRLSFENSQFDSRSLVFRPGNYGKNFDPRFTLRGWNIDSFNVRAGIKEYETNFGDESIGKHSEYSAYRATISIRRDAMGLFWKMFLGMYVSFLIAYVCFYIHSDNIDSRFGLSVGSLFAVIGNKYIIDSALPESTEFTLVDSLHGLTLLFIFAVITCTAYSIMLDKKDVQQKGRARRFDMIAAQVLFLAYLLMNIWLMYKANQN